MSNGKSIDVLAAELRAKLANYAFDCLARLEDDRNSPALIFTPVAVECRVFRSEVTGTSTVLRGVHEAEGMSLVYPDPKDPGKAASFVACVQWVNGTVPGPMPVGPRAASVEQEAKRVAMADSGHGGEHKRDGGDTRSPVE